ncbi:MAG: 4-hydroxy-3-methylbut-2-enyl diphosphate reductase [Marinilabiliaceae bacterium]|nr:4-hydroxy-3-methylbut-2-enyl diphosphate reductase [Marinilabiliaceae bacterium]
MPFTVTIDSNSGFCFGVVKAVEKAEHYLTNGHQLFSLGDIVHNTCEVERLENMGLKTVTTQQLPNITNSTILFRAHGEPPISYQQAASQNLQVIDATCPVVLKLQQRIRAAWEKMKPLNGQIIIYGKKGHPEVIGLLGQINNEGILIEDSNDLSSIDFTRPIELFSQTTKSISGFQQLISNIEKQACNKDSFTWHDTICRQVSNRVPKMEQFATTHDVVIFVGGAQSSNAKSLFNECLKHNPNSHFVIDANDLKQEWFPLQTQKVGVCGATSTPQWLLEQVADAITNQFASLSS